MKKIFSILFATLILFSGMHLTLATHICGGELAGVKLSFSGEKASCGMENNEQDSKSSNSISSNCCQNHQTVYSVDNNYNPSTFQLNDVTKHISQILFVPLTTSLTSLSRTFSSNISINKSDKLNLLANAVSLVNICVFRI